MVDTTSKTGVISQIIGPVVDVEFPSGVVPKIYNAVSIEKKGGDTNLLCEVQQLLGNIGTAKPVRLNFNHSSKT